MLRTTLNTTISVYKTLARVRLIADMLKPVHVFIVIAVNMDRLHHRVLTDVLCLLNSE